MNAAQQKNCTSPTVQKAEGASFKSWIKPFSSFFSSDGSESIEAAENENRCSDIERPFDGIRDDAFWSRIGYTDPREEDREEVSGKRTGITERRLDGIGGTFLLLVDHIAHHHLKRLHGDVDTCIQEHQAEQAEPHGGVQAKEG